MVSTQTSRGFTSPQGEKVVSTEEATSNDGSLTTVIVTAVCDVRDIDPIEDADPLYHHLPIELAEWFPVDTETREHKLTFSYEDLTIHVYSTGEVFVTQPMG